jgi:spoIIIJ-associated protein
MRRSVVIEVDPQAPRRPLSDEDALRLAQKIEPEVGAPPRRAPDRGRAPESRASDAADRGGRVALREQARPLAERYPGAEGEAADAVKQGLELLLELAGAEMESSVLQGDERYEIELWGPDQDLLLRDDGRPLLSIEHLLGRVVRGLTGEAVYCRVDCDQFHEIREERLRDLAQRVASEAVSSMRPRLLESMAPDERRIVHITLADDPGVETESQGEGYFKRVKIIPV